MKKENNKITLFHGSKSGIKGTIQPRSRKNCDFGQGFYMGTEESQPLTLICNFPNAHFYTMELELEGLKVLEIEVGLEWALLIAYNRGKMESIRGTDLYEKYKNYTKECDVIVGYIANDRMFVVLDRFFSGEITDVALIKSLSALKLGKQYVAMTERACSQIHIINEKEVGEKERQKLQKISEQNRREGIQQADNICRKYRREGLYFDEIMERSRKE